MTIYGILILGVVLDLACWRWRKLSNYLFIYECLYMGAISFVPLNYGTYEAFVICMNMLILILTIGCNAGVDIIISTLLYFLIAFVQSPLV